MGYTEKMYLAKILEKLPKNFSLFLKREVYKLRDDITEDYIKCVGSGFIKDPNVLYELIMYSKKRKNGKKGDEI